MLQHTYLKQDNEKLKEENSSLQQLVRDAQMKVKELSSSLQKGCVNVMPSMTVCNDLLEESSEKSFDRPATGFALAGTSHLQSPGLCLSRSEAIAVGQSNGYISFWSIRNKQSKLSEKKVTRKVSESLFRFSSERIHGLDEESPIHSISNPIKLHDSAVTSIEWLNSRTLSSVSLDSKLRIYDLNSNKSRLINLIAPSISHTILNNNFIVASCTNQIQVIDEKSSKINTLKMEDIITCISNTNLGLLAGTLTGKLHLIDPRMWNFYQSIQLSPAELPISKISGNTNITITSFDGVVRLLGNELPLFIEKEFSRAPIMGSIIGSCCVNLQNRDDFVISGSTNCRAFVWPKVGNSQSLVLKGDIIYDCMVLNDFVGSFITTDSSSTLSLWACSFNDHKDFIF